MSVKIRYREGKKRSKEERYSVYLDVYEKGQRSYEYPQIYVSEDYSDMTNIKKMDKGKIEFVKILKSKLEIELKNQQYGFAPTHLKKVNFIQFFEKLCEEKNAKIYWCTLKKLKDCFGSQLRFADFTEKRIIEFIKFCTDRVSQNTAYQYVKQVSGGFNIAVRRKIITTNPFNYIEKSAMPKLQETHREHLTINELNILKETPFKGNTHVKLAFMFACVSGLRISDIQKLRHSNINDNEIQYRQKKNSTSFQYLPLNPSANNIIQSIPKVNHSDLIFWDLPFSADYGNKLIREWVASAGINKRISWHCGRHTFACILLEYDADLYTVSKLLGHSTVKITEIYAKVIDKKKREAVNKIPQLW